MGHRASTILTPRHGAWVHLNAEKRGLLRPPAETSVEELLRRGMRLSRQAGRLRRAVQADVDSRRP